MRGVVEAAGLLRCGEAAIVSTIAQPIKTATVGLHSHLMDGGIRLDQLFTATKVDPERRVGQVSVIVLNGKKLVPVVVAGVADVPVQHSIQLQRFNGLCPKSA